LDRKKKEKDELDRKQKEKEELDRKNKEEQNRRELASILSKKRSCQFGSSRSKTTGSKGSEFKTNRGRTGDKWYFKQKVSFRKKL